jgi:hypothetical protein
MPLTDADETFTRRYFVVHERYRGGITRPTPDQNRRQGSRSAGAILHAHSSSDSAVSLRVLRAGLPALEVERQGSCATTSPATSMMVP